MMRHTFTRLLSVLALLIWGAAALAQDPPLKPDDPVYPFWTEIAENAEQTLDAAEDATISDLEALRKRLVAFRTEFDNQRSANAERIANLTSQINALGPVPESGVESTEITLKRTELEEQLEELEAPVRVADVAFRRADGLIGEIDSVLRDRQTRRLLELGPSPLDVRTWPVAFSDIARMLGDVGTNIADLSDQRQRERLQDRLPLVLFLMAVALTLIIKGRKWAASAVEYLRQFGGRGSGVWGFLASLLRIIIPLIGVYAFTYAARLPDVLDSKIETLLSLLPIWGLILLGFYWLGERLFSRNDDEAILPIPADKRASARFYVFLLSIFIVLRGVLAVLFELEQAQPATVAVIVFPVVLVTATALFLLGRHLRNCAEDEEESDAESEEESSPNGFVRVLRVAGLFMVAVAIAAPIMAGVGYAEAGNALLYPTVISAVLFGLVLVLQRFFADVYGLLTGQGSDARDGLAAVMINFVLLLASLPLLALIWGARLTDLTELWAQFMRGFDIGGTRISPSSFMIFAIVFAIGYTITRLLQSTLRQKVLPKTRLDIGGQNALVSGTGYIGIFLAALVAVTVAGLDLSGIAIVAGALSVGIGFGLQTIVSNFVSGIILLIERPISEGDWIEVGGQMGYVKQISVRATRIETFDRTDVIVPNSDLVSGTVTNYTRGNTIGRLIVKVGVAYGTDTRKVDGILREIAEAQPMVLRHPPPNVVFMGFGADSLDFEIRAILRDVNWMLNVKNDINHAIAERFTKEGIEIPFAQRDIWLRNPEALRSRDMSAHQAGDDDLSDDTENAEDEAGDATADARGETGK